MENFYQTSRHTAEMPVAAFFENYVDELKFLEYCKACYHYDKLWSCPPYDFSVTDFWKQFTHIKVTGVKILFPGEMTEKTYSKEEVKSITNRVLIREKDALTKDLQEEEKKYPGSVSLAAGNCSICGRDNCAKPLGDPCRCKGEMRYSIESLGGDVEKTARELLGIKLLWASETRLPDYFTLVGAILIK